MPTITDNLNLYLPDAGQSGVATELNNNWSQLDFRFDEAGGHTHDGTPGQGPKVPVTSLATTGTPSATTYLRGDGLWTTGTGGGGGVTDHGALTGLTDDDHPQYANQSRGDARYVQKANNLSDLANTATARTNIGAAAAVHQHAGADITTGTVPTARLGSGTPSTTTFLRGDQTWAVPGAGGSVNLDDLADVLITSPADNQVLSYDAAGARWINEAPAAGGGSTLDALTDTTITTPSDNQVLTYDSATSQWVNETPAAGLTNEDIDDRVNALIVAGTGITKTYDDTANTLTLAASAGGSAVDPLTTLTLVDDFFFSLMTTGNIGQLGWGFQNGTVVFGTATAHHPGVLQRNTGASINTVATLVLNNPANSGHLDPAALFDVTWVIRLSTNDANTTIRCGVIQNPGNVTPSGGAYLEKLAADTSWFGSCRLNTITETRTAALAPVTTGWVKLRVRRIDATTIAFSVDGSPEVTVTTNHPTQLVDGCLQIINTAAAAKVVDIDFFKLVVTGLTR